MVKFDYELNESVGEDELQRARIGRLPNEPEIDEPHFIVSVPHVTRGIVTRLFSDTYLMCSVYDWIGSLDGSPKYFQLRKYT